ncbi:Prokaryotic membrane lipoprotein lipid attachment site [Carpediemonas membranifera]|uniref:Prokaryotic membrane lipoprotein lipid attachment site n=1 Tax=Carpediemonas membranifera TaxID=201153 RepID=A0A8J6ASV4_9EUKA|nr:Prokaryotic membrane lipoprotein lipid attachment site [Carpediemonas membranifera]|eukprot:KAG9391535.1 Prokaryotic membrane lipoprotein lipid attachment site [Carpediemonas membranifera]
MGLGWKKQKPGTNVQMAACSPVYSATPSPMTSSCSGGSSASIIPEIPLRFENLENADYTTLERALNDPNAYAALLGQTQINQQLTSVHRRFEAAQSQSQLVYMNESTELSSNSHAMRSLHDQNRVLARHIGESEALLKAKKVVARKQLGQMAARNEADTAQLSKRLLFGEINVKDFTSQFVTQRVLMYERREKCEGM